MSLPSAMSDHLTSSQYFSRPQTRSTSLLAYRAGWTNLNAGCCSQVSVSSPGWGRKATGWMRQWLILELFVAATTCVGSVRIESSSSALRSSANQLHTYFSYQRVRGEHCFALRQNCFQHVRIFPWLKIQSIHCKLVAEPGALLTHSNSNPGSAPLRRHRPARAKLLNLRIPTYTPHFLVYIALSRKATSGTSISTISRSVTVLKYV